MLEWLLTLDRSIFLFINRGLANPVTDMIMPVITNDNFLRGIYASAASSPCWCSGGNDCCGPFCFPSWS